MHCPVCNHADTKVIDSRETGDGLGIRRRRECLECSYRFSTAEEAVLLDLTVQKRDGRRVPYEREKLESGLRKALEKRPCEQERFRTLVGTVERDIQKFKLDTVKSEQIGEAVMKRLKEFDTVAYIRFASVYRSFEDAKAFKEELQKLKTA